MLDANVIDGLLAAEPVSKRLAAMCSQLVEEAVKCPGVLAVEACDLLVGAGSGQHFRGHGPPLYRRGEPFFSIGRKAPPSPRCISPMLSFRSSRANRDETFNR